ncbi:MAG: SCO family protein [Ardenticatenia bacterium]|nr:SCO family protein [Ardenticatenia bacterium]
MGWESRSVALVAVILLFLTGVACGQMPAFKGTVLPDPVPAADFTLTDQHSTPFRLSEQRGRVVLLFFGYTNCPDVCPTTLTTWKQVEQALGQQAQDVRFVFITADPQRDTPERLRAHLAAFSPNFIGLTGTPEELASVYQAYHVFVNASAAEETAADYLVEHTAAVFAIDPDGMWRLTFPFGTSAEDMAHDVRLLLP